jgi:hypothetical protein
MPRLESGASVRMQGPLRRQVSGTVMSESSDISNCVHTFTYKMSLMALGCLLISFIGEERGHPLRICFAGGVSGAVVISWMGAGSSVWAAFRTRKRRIIRASILALTVAVAATIRVYIVVFEQ